MNEIIRFQFPSGPCNRVNGPFTRWSSIISSKVNSHHAINFRALCVANLVTYPPEFRGDETLEVHRVGARNRRSTDGPSSRKPAYEEHSLRGDSVQIYHGRLYHLLKHFQNRGTSPIRKCTLLGPCRRYIGGNRGVGVFLWAKHPCKTSTRVVSK